MEVGETYPAPEYSLRVECCMKEVDIDPDKVPCLKKPRRNWQPKVDPKDPKGTVKVLDRGLSLNKRTSLIEEQEDRGLSLIKRPRWHMRFLWT